MARVDAFILRASLFASLILLASPRANASTNKVGNGGSSVVCKATENKPASARLLDFYEVDLSRKFPQELDEYAIAKSVFENLKSSAPALGMQYLKRLESIRDELDFKNGVILTDTKDSDHLFRPSDSTCEVAQTAIRRPGETAGEKRFLIRKDVWDQLSALDRAGLLSHEIIYEHFSRLGETTSVKARKVNAFLFKSEAFKASEFWDLLRNLEVPIYP